MLLMRGPQPEDQLVETKDEEKPLVHTFLLHNHHRLMTTYQFDKKRRHLESQCILSKLEVRNFNSNIFDV